MKYEELLEGNLKYGTTKEDIIKRNGYEKILENVVIAPWWKHEIFDNSNLKMEQVSDYLYNYYGDDIEFSFLELRAIGAPAIMEYALPLGVTKCKNIVFVGSSGALDESIKIGDIIVPKYSICGEGVSRYLNSNLEDEFLKEEYPSKEMTDNLLKLLDENKIEYHYVPNFTVDTIFGQYAHLDQIIGYGAKSIEMETAIVFKSCKMMNINVTAIFCISDNTIANKSLFSGRTDEDKEKRRRVRSEIIPKITIDLFKMMNKKD